MAERKYPTGRWYAEDARLVLFARTAAPITTTVLAQGNPFQQPTSVTPAPIIAAISDLLH